MKVLALDLSTSTGVAVFVDGKLKDHTVIKEKVKGNNSSDDYPTNYVDMADKIAQSVEACVITQKPNYIVIEETNKSRNRFSQKQLEFIHCCVARRLNYIRAYHNLTYQIKYIDTSAWRFILGISLDSSQRKGNKAHKTDKEIKREEISKGIYNDLHYQIKKEVVGLKKRETNKIIKKWDKEILKMVGIKMRSIKSSIKKTDTKDLAVNYVNRTFGLKLKKSQNDIADAICVGHAFIKNGHHNVLPKEKS